MSNIFKPITVIPKKWANVLCWIIFIILFSNLGLILAIFDALNKGSKVVDIFVTTFNSGAFYLNGISLLASYIGAIFIDFFNESKNTKFIKFKITSLMVSATILVLMSGNYSSIYSAQDLTWVAYSIQGGLYVLSILVGLYIFCISCIECKDQFDNYAQYSDERRDETAKSGNKLNDDGEGVTI